MASDGSGFEGVTIELVVAVIWDFNISSLARGDCLRYESYSIALYICSRAA